MQKKEDEEWVVVESSKEFNEVFAAYDHTLIGRALFLSKLEEAAEVRDAVEIDAEFDNPTPMVDVAEAFDKRVGEIIKHWREFLFEGVTEGNLYSLQMADKVLDNLLLKLESALKALKLKTVDLTPKRDKKRKLEEDDDYSPESARAFCVVDRATKSVRLPGQESPGAQARRESLRSAKAAKRSKDQVSIVAREGSTSTPK